MWTWYYLALLAVFWVLGMPFGLHSERRYEQYICYYYELPYYDGGFVIFLASFFASWLAVIYWETVIILDSRRFERKKRDVASNSIEDLIRETEKRR